MVSIGADAHNVAGIGHVEYGVAMARKGWLGPADILNARPVDDFIAFAARTPSVSPRGKAAGRRLAAATRAPGRKGAAPRRRSGARVVLRRLKRRYPDARCALDHRNAFELLCGDHPLRPVHRCPGQHGDADAVRAVSRRRRPSRGRNPEDVEEIIRSTGFFRNKARSLIGMAQALVAEHGGEVPAPWRSCGVLPGVGRKTANVVLGQRLRDQRGGHGGHPRRAAEPDGSASPGKSDPVKIERDLMPLFPRNEWALLSHLLIFHGRQICVARRPRCAECPLADLCPSAVL